MEPEQRPLDPSRPIDPPRPVHRSFLLLGIAALILMLFLWGWIPHFLNTRKIDAIAAENPLPRVFVMQIKPNKNLIELILPSSAQAWHITPIWARVNGYLLRYLVDIGDTVKKGDLLAEIDTPEADELVAQSQADLKNANEQNNIAKITSDRWQRLWEKNPEAVTKQDVDQYSANYKSTQALVTASEKSLSRNTYEQKFKFIYAPFDGVITQRNIDIGSLIYGSVNGVPQELFQLAQTDTIRFFVEVPQNYFRQIQDGVEAEVTVREFPGKVFKGVVSRYAKALDPTARTLLTQVNVDNREGTLYAGLFGLVKFLIKPDNVDFQIPTTAIIIRAGFPHVAVVDENNVVQLKRVQIGRDYGKQMEITFGLQENDRIITIPSDKIHEGVKVDIVSEENIEKHPTSGPVVIPKNPIPENAKATNESKINTEKYPVTIPVTSSTNKIFPSKAEDSSAKSLESYSNRILNSQAESFPFVEPNQANNQDTCHF